MASKHSNLIFQLCFENTIPTFYKKKIINNLSGQEINVSYEQDKLEPISNFFTVSDIPDYLEIELHQRNKNVALKRVVQYQGYLIRLKEFNTLNEFINNRLSKNTRKNLKAKLRKIEENHKIKYKFHHGEIDKDHYDYLFDICYNLMKERFNQKKIFNRFLLHWRYYYDLFYPKILKKEASIFVIYDDMKPITITLNFHKADIVFSFIQIYNTDYYKYSMGDIAMYKNIGWCYENNYSIWDVSKGQTENKRRWSNHIYKFEHHLFYKSNSILAKWFTLLTANQLRFKQILRDKGIIGGIFQLDRVYYYTKRLKLKNYNWKEDN